MTQEYLIGIDIGSSTVRAFIFDTQGHELADAKRDNYPQQPRPGVAEYDGPQIVRATLEAIREALERSGARPSDVLGLCVDAMISGAMGMDAHGEATTPYTTTLDMRFAPQLNDVMDHFHARIRELTGSGQPTVAPKMMWIRDAFPDIYKRTAKFVTVSGYVLGKMAGLPGDEAFVDTTYLWATGLSDTQNYAWSDELCSAMDLPMEKLPRIVKSSEVIGGLCQEAARATGLPAGTPIVAGAGDQSAGFIGAGLTQPNRMGDAAGTYPVLSLCTDEFRPDLENLMAEIVPSPIPGLWNPVSLIIGGGLTHHWFLETFAYVDEVEDEKRGGTSIYSALDDKARNVSPGSDRLVFNPHLGGRACPTRTNYRGMWIGFTWTHRREHFYRSVLEAVAYDQYLAFQSLKAAYPESSVEEVIVYAGGAKSSLWNQIKADVMGLPYVCLNRENLSALGAAILAGYGLGIYDDMAETARRFVKHTDRFEPRPAVHEFYRAYAEFYGRLLDRVEPAYDELATLPQWEGPLS